MEERVWYPMIEVDQNNPRLFDVVTKDHADDLEVGGKVLLVASDYKTIESYDGVQIRRLDWGWATWGRVTSIEPTKSDPNLFVVRAEFDDADSK